MLGRYIGLYQFNKAINYVQAYIFHTKYIQLIAVHIKKLVLQTIEFETTKLNSHIYIHSTTINGIDIDNK